MADQHTSGRSIVLFSDGTGNSSAKLQKTNVWRFYEALDLGAPAQSGTWPEQIAYYDDGVGTSSFAMLATIAGIFGFGLARNVREIYKFLCRNYRPGDRIYALGFSRGAFTIRLLIAMICQHGVIGYDSESDLDRQVHDVWREFRRDFRTSGRALIVGAGRVILRALVRAKRLAFRQRTYAAALDRAEKGRRVAAMQPNVTFVGVWDTVAAYGGPIVEITRAVDEWIWPLTMNDYRLSERVERARHALAIDDKRDAFSPLPWDEIHERELVGEGKVPPDRLRQVWFAGMHADVGGGYSDETLSYVSLCWMIDNATANLPPDKRLRLLPEAVKRLQDMANKYGAIHDSRGGGGAFYRYQPRNIAALTEPLDLASLTQLDPDIDYEGKERKLNALLAAPITIHPSVYDRLRDGTDGYGPNNLPATFRIEGHPEPVTVAGGEAPIDWLWDTVLLRRAIYFLTFWLVVVLAAMPWWPQWFKDLCPRVLDVQVDARDATTPLVALANALLPSFAERWTKTYAAGFLTFLPWFIVILAVIAWGTARENAMTDEARAMWARHFGKPAAAANPRHPLLRTIRDSLLVNRLLAWWKWSLVPKLLGFLMLLGVLYVAFATIAQVGLIVVEWRLPRRAAGFAACPRPASLPAAQRLVPGDAHVSAYDTRCPFNRTGLTVQKGASYTIEIDGVDSWYDGVASTERNTDGSLATASRDAPAPHRWIKADPSGWAVSGEEPVSRIAIRWFSPVFRRVMREPFFAPLVEIAPRNQGVVILATNMTEVGEGRWRGHFTATRSGPLYVFVNDAMLPFDPGDGHWLEPARLIHRSNWFEVARRYENNAGAGTVTIRQGDPGDDPECKGGCPAARAKR